MLIFTNSIQVIIVENTPHDVVDEFGKYKFKNYGLKGFIDLEFNEKKTDKSTTLALKIMPVIHNKMLS